VALIEKQELRRVVSSQLGGRNFYQGLHLHLASRAWKSQKEAIAAKERSHRKDANWGNAGNDFVKALVFFR
jgi:hypothetical protein